MPPVGGKSAGKRAPKNGGIGSAVLHHCLRKQAESSQRHNQLIQLLKQGGAERSINGPTPGRVALGGNISRHRTLEFLSGSLTSANASKGSVQSKHTEQHLRSVIERSGLDEYLSTALAAQETFTVDRYEARLLHETTTPCLLSTKFTQRERRADGVAEGGDVHIPRRPVFFSRGKVEACRQEEQTDRAVEGIAARSRRRRNRARVKLLLADKVEEATVHNVQFVRQQRDELHRRYRKPKDPKASKRRGRPLVDLVKQALPDLDQEWGAESEVDEDLDSDVSQSSTEARADTCSDEANTRESDSGNDISPKRLKSTSNTSDLDTEDESHPDAQPVSPNRLPRTIAELDEVEMDSFLQWRRSLAEMEADGVVLTPYERNLEVWRQLWRVVERSHLVLQIVDGRSPAFFRCKDLEKYVKEVSPDKHVILVVNKSDLLPSDVREEWSRYFANAGVDVIFFSALRELNFQAAEAEEQPIVRSPSGTDMPNIMDNRAGQSESNSAREPWSSTPATGSSCTARTSTFGKGGGNLDGRPGASQDIMSCGSLMNLLEQYRDKFLVERVARRETEDGESPEDFVVGTVGYPNVGKSSLINALMGMKKVSVSHQPGKTRRLQTIPLKGRGITLCDCPGLVFPKAVVSKHILVLNGVVSVDEMRGDYLPAIQLVCDWIPHTLLQHYGITADAYREAHKVYLSIQGPADPRMALGIKQEIFVDRLEATPVLLAIAAQRHFVSGGKGGQLDLYRVAKLILGDFTAGRLLRCHIPGGRVFGGEAETIATAKFLSVVRISMETRIGEVGSTTTLPLTTSASRGARALMSSGDLQQMNPMAVLKQLEEDLDLLEVVDNGEACQASGHQASAIMTKRKARQMQKQMLKGKGKGVPGLAHRC